jgi:hypothetical protein
LSAKIVVKSKVPLETDELKAELVLSNDGDKPLRVCTLCPPNGTRGAGSKGFMVTRYFRPELWGSGKPTAEEFAKHVVTLKPGDRVALPFEERKVRGIQGKFKIMASYSIGAEFAKEHNIWAGRVAAEPVDVAVRQGKGGENPGGDQGKGDAAKQLKLSLTAEVENRDGKPFAKVYLVNPSNIALELVDWNEPAFALEKLCSVKVDGKSADLRSLGAFLIPGRKMSKKTLPAEDKTLLGVVAFDHRTAAQFKGNTPVVLRLVATGPNSYTLLPLTPAKHTIEIQVNRTLMTQFPADVSPASFEVDLSDKPAKVEELPKPAVIDDGKTKRLSLAAEVENWKGQPYVKVYLVNPSNINLQLVGRNRDPDLGVACAVKVDGAEADLLSRAAVALKPGLVKRELPAEGKTLLGTFVFGPLDDPQLAGAPEVRMRVRPYGAPPGSYTLLRLPPGKHTVEIRPSTASAIQFPTDVTPVTVQVDLPK